MHEAANAQDGRRGAGPPVQIVLRPLASPLPIGFFASQSVVRVLNAARSAVEADLGSQVAAIEREAGVRGQL